MKKIAGLLILLSISTVNYSQMSERKDNQYLLSARPSAISIRGEDTALIVVDMQNDFCTNGGMLQRIGIDILMIQNIIPNVKEAINAARVAGIKIIYLKMGYKEDLSDLGSEQSPNRDRHLRVNVGVKIKTPDGRNGQILIRDTWNTDIVSELKPQDEDVIIYKTRYSGFYKTDLDSVLKQNQIKNIIFTGCTTSVCVESTVRDAMFRDYSSIVLEDCTAEPIGYDFERTNHVASLLTMELQFGWISNSALFKTALEKK